MSQSAVMMTLKEIHRAPTERLRRPSKRHLHTYKKKSGLFDFLGTTQSGFPTEPGEYVQTAKAAGNYSSSEISRTIVIR